MLDAPHTLAFVLLFTALLWALSGMAWPFLVTAFLVTLAAACIAGIVGPQGAGVALVGLALAHLRCLSLRNPIAERWGMASIMLTALLALALGFHGIPGFKPAVLTHEFGRDAAHPLVWQFDKGLGGLLLLLVWRDLPSAPNRLRMTVALALCPVVLIAFALLSGIVHFDPRWLPGTGYWLISNLFLTVIAEEAFFRGLLQHHLSLWLQARVAYGAHLAIVIVAILFAIVHVPWGWIFAIGAGVAGMLYGYLYQCGGLRWAIAGHILSNGALLVLTRSPLG